MARWTDLGMCRAAPAWAQWAADMASFWLERNGAYGMHEQEFNSAKDLAAKQGKPFTFGFSDMIASRSNGATAMAWHWRLADIENIARNDARELGGVVVSGRTQFLKNAKVLSRDVLVAGSHGRGANYPEQAMLAAISGAKLSTVFAEAESYGKSVAGRADYERSNYLERGRSNGRGD
jgi:hypothetical protein